MKMEIVCENDIIFLFYHEHLTINTIHRQWHLQQTSAKKKRIKRRIDTWNVHNIFLLPYYSNLFIFIFWLFLSAFLHLSVSYEFLIFLLLFLVISLKMARRERSNQCIYDVSFIDRFTFDGVWYFLEWSC